MNISDENKKNILTDFNWMRFRIPYALFSITLVTIGIISLVTNGLLLGVDFTGGAVATYHFEKAVAIEELTNKIEGNNIQVSSIQPAENNNYILKFKQIETAKEEEIRSKLAQDMNVSITLESFENVGPSIGPELIKKTMYAVLIATSLILLWVAYQFRSIRYGVSATVATIHDTLILLGAFSLFGRFFNAEADFLFVTAVLTTLSFSVHDTIVVFDRIREIRRKNGGEMKVIANKALTETMRRSIANSLTIIFMLLALIALGGATTRWFAVALLIGTISGTYSSPFVAVPLLVTWDQLTKRLRQKEG